MKDKKSFLISGTLDNVVGFFIAKCDNLDEMLSYIDDEKDGFDIAWNLFKKGFSDILLSPEEYGFEVM